MGLFKRKPRDADDQVATVSSVSAVTSDITQLRNEISKLLDRVAAAEADREGVIAVRLEFSALAERLTEFDARITAVSTELANQISELGTELSTLGRPTADGEQTSLDGLREAQTRLAAEQARYQIAFRQDLAELADRLRPR